MMISLDPHAKLRYVQRVLHITDPQEAKYYLRINDRDISYSLWKMLDDSLPLLEDVPFGESGKIMSNIRRHGEYVLIVDLAKNALVTLYQVSLNERGVYDKEAFDTKANTIRQNTEEIVVMKRQKEKLDEENQFIRSTITMLQKQLDSLEEREKEMTNTSRQLNYQIKDKKRENKRIFKSLKTEKSRRKHEKVKENKELLSYSQTWTGKSLQTLKKQAAKQTSSKQAQHVVT